MAKSRAVVDVGSVLIARLPFDRARFVFRETGRIAARAGGGSGPGAQIIIGVTVLEARSRTWRSIAASLRGHGLRVSTDFVRFRSRTSSSKEARSGSKLSTTTTFVC